MTMQPPREQLNRAAALPPLENGERLDQKTFHERYEAMPAHVRAELIGGRVFIMPSPLKRQHGRHHGASIFWLTLYSAYTPGTEVLDNATTILSDESEPQPDCSLYILPEHGGQVRDEGDDYVHGGPDFLAEIAWSSASIDLDLKFEDYEKAGVREYLVVVLREQRIAWHVRHGGRFEELAAGTDSIHRSEIFPGLWLDSAALLRHDPRRVEEILRQGLATPEHQAFVESLRRS